MRKSSCHMGWSKTRPSEREIFNNLGPFSKPYSYPFKNLFDPALKKSKGPYWTRPLFNPAQLPSLCPPKNWLGKAQNGSSAHWTPLAIVPFNWFGVILYKFLSHILCVIWSRLIMSSHILLGLVWCNVI